MKIQVRLTQIYESICEIDSPCRPDEIKGIIKTLTNDDFQDEGEHYTIEVVDENGKDITAEIQPLTPHIQL